MRNLFKWVLAATLVCGAGVFTSCTKSVVTLSDKMLGKWMVVDLDGDACPTSMKVVATFNSETQALCSLSDMYTKLWENKTPVTVAFTDDKFTVIEEEGKYKSVLKVTVSSVSDTEMFWNTDWTVTEDGQEILHETYQKERWVRVTDNFENAIIGTWETTTPNTNEIWRWDFKANGTYVFSQKFGDSPWLVYEDKVAEYFVDGTLLCTRWQNTEESDEERDWWEIESLKNGQMMWMAVRTTESLTNYTERLILHKIQ